jgi:hypothetical protein
LANNSRMTLPSTGDYVITFSAMCTRIGAGTATLDIWLAKNGTNVARSSTRQTVTNGADQIMAVSFIVDCSTPGDYYELMMCGSNTEASLQTIAASASNPTRPAAPCIIACVWKITK